MSLVQRQNLQLGQADRLIFEIEYKEKDNDLIVQSKRMWVIVAEKTSSMYISILNNQLVYTETEDDVL